MKLETESSTLLMSILHDIKGGKRRMYEDIGKLKKGPWNEEEDKVLLNHVKKYGPRDWSSI